MFVKFKSENKLLEVFFEEEIDHHSCLLLANLLDDELKKYTPSIVLFNFEKVSFMDSSGIALILGRSALGEDLGFSLQEIKKLLAATEEEEKEMLKQKKGTLLSSVEQIQGQVQTINTMFARDEGKKAF
jgi:anti-anti-sigma factor